MLAGNEGGFIPAHALGQKGLIGRRVIERGVAMDF